MNADAVYCFDTLWKHLCSRNSKLSGKNTVEKHLSKKKLREQLSGNRAVVVLQPLETKKDLLAESCQNKISELDQIVQNANKIDPVEENMLRTGNEFKEVAIKVETSDESDSSDNEKLSIVSKRLQISNDILKLPYPLRSSSRKRKKCKTFKSVENLSVKSSKIIHKEYPTKQKVIYCCEEDAVCDRQTHHSLHIEIPRLFLQGQRHHLFLGNKLCEETFADLAMKAKQCAFESYPKESINRNGGRRDTVCSSIITSQSTAEEAEISQLVRNLIPGDESEDEETWKATSVLESINYNGLYKSESHIAKSPISFEPSSSKGHCSSAKVKKRRYTGKRGRKPKKEVLPLPQPQPKCTLAEYVENFGNDFDTAGSVTPAASSGMTLPVVSSTTQIFDPRDPGTVMCYIEGDWANGGTCQLVDANGLSITGTQIQTDSMNDTTLSVEYNALNANFEQPILPLSSFAVSTLIQPCPVIETTALQNKSLDNPVINIQIPNIPAITSSCKDNEIQLQPLPAHIKPPSSPIHSSYKSNEKHQQPFPAHSPIFVLDLSIKSKESGDLDIPTDMNNTNADEVADDNYATLPLDLSASATEPMLSDTNEIIANELDAGLSQSLDCREDNNDSYNNFVRSLGDLNFDRYTDNQNKGRDMPLLNLNSEAGDVFIGGATKSLPVDSNYVSMNEENGNLQSHRSPNNSAKDIWNNLLDIGPFGAENDDNNNQDNNLCFLDLDYEKFVYTEIPTSTFKVLDVNGDKIDDQNVTNDQRQESKEANKDIHLSLYTNIEEIKFSPTNGVEKCDSMALNKENCEQLEQCLDDITKNNNSPDKTCADFSSALAKTTCSMPEINSIIFGTKNMDAAKKSDNTFEQQNDKNQDDDKNDSKINCLSKSDHAVESDATTSSHTFNILQYIEEANLYNVLNNSKLVGSSEEPIVPHADVPKPYIELANDQQIVENCERKILNKTNSNKGDKISNKLNKKTSENSRRQSLNLPKTNGTEIKTSSTRIIKKTKNYKKKKTSNNEKLKSEFNESDIIPNTNDNENAVPFQNVTPASPSQSSTKIVFSVKKVELSDSFDSFDTSCDSFEKERKKKAQAEDSKLQENLNHIVMQLDDDALETLHKKPAITYSCRQLQHGDSPKKDETEAVYARLNFDDENKCKSSAEVTAYLTNQDSDTGNGSSCQGSENISLEETMNLSSQESRQSINDCAHLTNRMEGNIHNGNEKNESISQSVAVNTSPNSCKSIPKMSSWHIESKLDEDNLDFEPDYDDTLSITASDICSPSDHFTESLDCYTNHGDVLPPADRVITESNAYVFQPAVSVTTNSIAGTKPAAESSLEDLKNFKIPKLNKSLSAKFSANKKDTKKVTKSFKSIVDINHFSLQPYVRLNRISINKDGKYNVTKELTDGHQIIKKNISNTTLGNKKTMIDDDNLNFFKNQILNSKPKKSDKVKHHNNGTKTRDKKLSLKAEILKFETKTTKVLNIDRVNLSRKPQTSKSASETTQIMKHINSNIPDKVKHHNPAPQCSENRTIYLKNIFGITCMPYLGDFCYESHCQYSHEVNDNETVFNSLQVLNQLYLMEAYTFMYNNQKLYESFFLTFCNLYIVRLDRYKLLSMAIDCERYPRHSQFLDEVYEGLVKCGLSRANACNYILRTTKEQSPEFRDALVAIIIKSDWTLFADDIERLTVEYNFRFGALEKMYNDVLHSNNRHLLMVFWKCVQVMHKDDLQLLALHSNTIFEWMKTIETLQILN